MSRSAAEQHHISATKSEALRGRGCTIYTLVYVSGTSDMPLEEKSGCEFRIQQTKLGVYVPGFDGVRGEPGLL